MDTDPDIREKRRLNPARANLAKTGLYHSFLLPNGKLAEGSMSLAWQQERLESFRLPHDLTGKRVLDIGPWDGYYTFEMERRGATVTAVDVVDLDTFRTLHSAYRSSATYIQAELYELDPASLGTFDIVLCLGLLYHLKHPFLAMEKLCALTSGVCIIDTFVIDGKERLRGDSLQVLGITALRRPVLLSRERQRAVAESPRLSLVLPVRYQFALWKVSATGHR